MELIRWLTDAQLNLIYTSEYWNDIEAEKQKKWWICDGEYDQCIDYLESSGLLSEYQEAESHIQKLDRGELEVGDFAAGIGWTSALLSKLDCVKMVHAVEISKHRIGELFEHSVNMLDGNPQKIKRYLGSFYETRFENESLDVVVLCHAFHHADDPVALLHECQRVLAPNGNLLIVGEHLIGATAIARRFISRLIKNRVWKTSFRELFPADPVLGDHFYKISDYQSMFSVAGMHGRLVRAQSGSAMYVVRKG